jgi:hypothetical protein
MGLPLLSKLKIMAIGQVFGFFPVPNKDQFTER